jgi:hypothetical protein
MPFSISHEDGGKWKVVNSETNDIKGEHDSEEDAKKQLAALYANVEDVKKMQQFIPITKVDKERREVWGWAALEQPDNANEILDYASSKPLFDAWSNAAQKRSGGKSMGNLRSMHHPNAAGKIIDFRADDVSKGFYVGAKIVDDNEWHKVEEGVYTGFSVGGSYLRRWPDGKQAGLIRYTAKPAELSLVDAPCIPGATFQMIKSDGTIDLVPFREDGSNSAGLVVTWDEEELEKAITSPVQSPEPMVPEHIKGNLNYSANVTHMPPQVKTLEIAATNANPTNIPTSEQLTAATAAMKDLCDMVKSMIGTMPATIQKAIQVELDRVIEEPMQKSETVPPSGTPYVKPLKVERK